MLIAVLVLVSILSLTSNNQVNIAVSAWCPSNWNAGNIFNMHNASENDTVYLKYDNKLWLNKECDIQRDI